MSIHDYLQKIKPQLPDILIVLCIVLLCTGLAGFYSSQAKAESGVGISIIQATSTSIAPVAKPVSVGVGDNRPVYASKNGSKFYYSGCTGLKRIKESNLVTFASASLAISQGYGLAKGCK